MVMNIDYRIARLRDLRVETTRSHQTDPEKAVGLELEGRLLAPTTRFWRSLFHRYGLNPAVFRYFDYDEVLARIVQRDPNDSLRFCVQRSDRGRDHLLAVSNPGRPILTYDHAMRLLGGQQSDSKEYWQGVVTSRHTPRSGEHSFAIGPDQFRNRFVAEMPIDGYGQPRIFLSLLRQICTNGAVGYTRVFRSDIRIGQDAAYILARALDQFDHDEGFAALRQRFESAQTSWASIHEALLLRKTLERLEVGGGLRRHGLVEDLSRLAGDLNALYGLANLDSLSAKRQRVLPARCRVYDLLNFASETATHHAGPEASARLQAYIGTLISEEYDLEGTAEKVPEFKGLLASAN